MRPLCTAGQMRGLDRTAIEGYGLPGVVLMENAGQGMARAILEEFGPVRGQKVAVLCGRGNNGGDGFVIGRWLARAGADVSIYLMADPEKITGDALTNYRIARRLGLPITAATSVGSLKKLEPEIQRSNIFIDALLGTGLNSPVRGVYREAVEILNRAAGFKAAVDLPSGLDSDTGRVQGVCVQADLTCTFGLVKVGQAVHPGVSLCGRLRVIDIGLPETAVAEVGLDHFELEADDAARFWPQVKPDGHKGSAGHLLVVAGSPGKTGAACLTAQGALRAGAGLVTVGCPASLNPILETKMTEVMTAPLAESSQGTLCQRSIEGLSPLVQGKSAVAVGPGLSENEDTAAVLAWLVERVPLPMVIDADGLNLLAKQPGLMRWAAEEAVLTPHPGEMGRLLGLSSHEVQDDRVGSARRLARETGQVVLLKGARSVVAVPDGRIFINPTGNPGLATGGTGDVLTGVIGALLAQGLSPLEAARTGAYVHGLSADRLWTRIGGRGYCAGEVAEEIPAAVAALQKTK